MASRRHPSPTYQLPLATTEAKTLLDDIAECAKAGSCDNMCIRRLVFLQPHAYVELVFGCHRSVVAILRIKVLLPWEFAADHASRATHAAMFSLGFCD